MDIAPCLARENRWHKNCIELAIATLAYANMLSSHIDTVENCTGKRYIETKTGVVISALAPVASRLIAQR